MEIALSVVHLAFVAFIALFPPVNPIGTALVVDPLLHGLDTGQRRAAALKIALYCFAICGSTVLVGSWLFTFFGISLPVVQIAGGVMICHMGWQFLSADDKKDDQQPPPDRRESVISEILFYPLAFPMTTGAGTISVLLTLSAHAHSRADSDYLLSSGALFMAILLMCVAIYLSYAYTPALLRRLGRNGHQILNRLSAFLVFCVGLQICVEGITHLVTKN